MAPPISPVSADGSHVGEATKSFGDTQNLSVSQANSNCEPKISYDQNIPNSPASYEMDDKKDCIGEGRESGDFDDDLSFLLNEPFIDSVDKFPNADEGFIEANDLSNNPFGTKSSAFDMLEEYLDAGDDSSFYFACDPAMMFGSEDLLSNQTLLPQMDMDEGTQQANFPSVQLIGNHNINAALTPNKPRSTEYKPDFPYQFNEKASRKLGNVHAPPAYAAEFPSKDAILRLNSIAQSYPSSVHGTIEVRNLNRSGKRTSVSIVPGKTVSAICRGWLCFIFFWVLMSFRGWTHIGVK